MFLENQEITVIISLFSLGLFGGFTHCIAMCGPFVLTQVNNRLQKLPIEKLNNFQKLSGIALVPYHLGRITTYTLVGGLASFLTVNLKEVSGFKLLSAIMLFIAAVVFIANAFSQIKLRIKLPFKINLLKNCQLLIKFMGLLFADPYKFKGYVLGIMLGFIPCGLLYGAVIATASLDNYFVAALAMLCFGIATIPALFFTACGSYLLLSKIEKGLKLFAKVILLINGIVLLIMAIGLVFDKI